MMFQKRGKNVPKIDLTDKSWFSCVFSDQSFLYEKPLVFSSIFFWIASRIKLSPPQDEISFVKDLDMSIKSVKAQKRETSFSSFSPFLKAHFFSSSALASFVNCKKIGKIQNKSISQWNFCLGVSSVVEPNLVSVSLAGKRERSHYEHMVAGMAITYLSTGVRATTKLDTITKQKFLYTKEDFRNWNPCP